MTRGLQATVAALFVTAFMFGITSRTSAQADARIWTGVFSSAQVERGKEAFEANCARCHQPTLGGSDRGPALKGDNFWSHWENETLNTLFVKVRDNMPPNLTGNQLEPQTKLDIVTYVLRSNDFPVGDAELKPEPRTLDEIQILKKGAPPSVPNFALVRVVGCLSRDSSETWVLTSTSTPTATTQPVAPGSTDSSSADKALGDDRYVLTSIKTFEPEAQQGHKVEARGLIYKAPGHSRIDLTSLQTLATTCGS